MAEIKIEKKKKPVWPWIVALLAIAAILVWVWTDDPGADEPAVATDEQLMTEEELDALAEREDSRAGEAELSGSVGEYVQYVEANGSTMGLEHEYTHRGITRLAEALEAMAEDMPDSPEVDGEVSRLKEQADQLMKEKESERHANMIRDAFMTSANIIEEFQQMNYPRMEAEVQDLKAKAENIDKEELATEQNEAVNEFFAHSADVIEKMAQNSKT